MSKSIWNLFQKSKELLLNQSFLGLELPFYQYFLTLIIRMNLETTIFYAVNLTRKIDMSFLFMSATDNYILKKMGESTFQDIILVWFVKRILKQIWHKNKKFCSSFFYILEIFILNINEVYYYQSNSSLDLSLYIWTFLNEKTFLTH